ncbi:zinc-dependent alcohol dehydrogenase family protein [Streptomyces sp. ITFR-16]|uniref:zinc-dependent alcohol dehydrogenase family protein n=1 Tax=Streptomyces sp. ITFR-16 TaxID=3075198 RepID=UPI0028891A69|nr:zinc-dependent alcohol dehydrogenase family protein [Streptomyces sp. ITFR-16]WNI25477.1 zinc-dependent alcohol dehydrogenase family protein [Streptomyces sp. ITFR-16]
MTDTHTSAPATTRAVLFHTVGDPDVLTVEEVPLPAPGPGEVLVRVEALGLNRAEALFRAGTYFYQPTLPASRNGYEAAGTVEAVGPGVEEFAPGDPVTATHAQELSGHGLYAERVVAPAGYVFHRPEGVDAAHGAAVWLTYSTAYGALIEKGGLRPGDHVLITGASSGVGTAALQVANRIGAVPVATTRTRAKKRALLDAGAAHVVTTDDEDLVKEVGRITGGAGVRLILDAIGGPGFATLGEAAAPDGTLVQYGWLDGRPTVMPLNWPLTVIGYNNLALSADPAGRRRAAHFIASGLRSGALAPVVGATFDGLERMADAHRLMESNTHTGKIVVTVRH